MNNADYILAVKQLDRRLDRFADTGFLSRSQVRKFRKILVSVKNRELSKLGVVSWDRLMVMFRRSSKMLNRTFEIMLLQEQMKYQREEDDCLGSNRLLCEAKKQGVYNV